MGMEEMLKQMMGRPMQMDVGYHLTHEPKVEILHNMENSTLKIDDFVGALIAMNKKGE